MSENKNIKSEEKRSGFFSEEAQRLRREARQRVVGYISAALALVAGLAWNEAIKEFIQDLYPLQQNTLTAKFIYAAALTIFITIIITILEGRAEKEK